MDVGKSQECDLLFSNMMSCMTARGQRNGLRDGQMDMHGSLKWAVGGDPVSFFGPSRLNYPELYALKSAKWTLI